MCYDPAGRAYVLPGSERFVGYLRWSGYSSAATIFSNSMENSFR